MLTRGHLSLFFCQNLNTSVKKSGGGRLSLDKTVNFAKLERHQGCGNSGRKHEILTASRRLDWITAPEKLAAGFTGRGQPAVAGVNEFR
jgi:hypothetical protein